MMSSPRYRYGHKSGKRRSRKIVYILTLSFLVIGTIAGFVISDMRRNSSAEVAGESREVTQDLSKDLQQITVNEPTFTMKLPSDWKEVGRRNDRVEHSVTWQATKKNEDNRTLTVYVDIIPTKKPVNRLLPLTVQGNMLRTGDISVGCETFTKGGVLDAREASRLLPTVARWNGVDFICNLPRIVDNEIGAAAPGAINTTTVTGPTQGTHKYFFLYTDRNFQPNNTIFYNAMQSFQAK